VYVSVNTRTLSAAQIAATVKKKENGGPGSPLDDLRRLFSVLLSHKE
jgi:hypothetical protein